MKTWLYSVVNEIGILFFLSGLYYTLSTDTLTLIEYKVVTFGVFQNKW